MCPAAKSEEKMDITANTKVKKRSLLCFCRVPHTQKFKKKELNEVFIA